jgi:hypothetical protein
MNCTVSGNAAQGERGGGIFCWERSSPVLVNCIVWGNDPEPIGVRDGSLPDVSYCCTDGDGAWPGDGNFSADPLLLGTGEFDFDRYVTVTIDGWEGSLPDFIVVEPDYHIQAGSPCSDAGTNEGAPTTDIEGSGRPCGGGVDVGAYEAGGCAASDDTFRRGDANNDGRIDVADAVSTLWYVVGQGPVPSCLDAADANDDGVLNIADGIYILHYLFAGGPAVPRPYRDCGIDPTDDGLGCAAYGHCPQ